MTLTLTKIFVLTGALALGSSAFAQEGCDGCEPTPPPTDGCDGCEPDPNEDVKGNNGWGNGPDTTNAGSFSGATAPSKSSNGAVNGRHPKFEGR